MMNTKNFYLKLTLLLVLTAMMSACGATKDTADNYDSSSRLSQTDLVDTDPLNRPLAFCNQASNSEISVATSTYQDGETISLTRINLKLLKIPTNFTNNVTYIEFHKYMTSSIGSKIWGSSRLTFSIFSIADGSALVTGKEYLYWTELKSAAQKLSVSTAEQFFKKVRIVIELDDAVGDYDVISTFVYDHGDDSSESQLDSLIPVFDADPIKYAIERDGSVRHSSLQALHPFKSYVGQGWTSQTYQTKSQEFCKPIYTVQ